jgi:TatD DNase family protein
MFINIHTHTVTTAPHVTAVQSYYNNFSNIPATGLFTAGLHPWYVDDNWQQAFKALRSCIAMQQNIAIGECGLDKVCDTSFDIQQQAFAAQIQLAALVKKPLIIHCVKAYDQVLHMLQRHSTPIIFHGFNKSVQLATALVNKGYYLSLGSAILQPRMYEVLQAIPLQQLFLETDAATISIEEIYTTATAILQIDINALSLQLKKNAATVFGAAIFKEI